MAPFEHQKQIDELKEERPPKKEGGSRKQRKKGGKFFFLIFFSKPQWGLSYLDENPKQVFSKECIG